MTDMEMVRVNTSYAMDLAGNVETPAPTVRLIKSKAEFTRFLQDRTLFFDGRFAFYGEYEGADYYEKHDLVALILRGEHTLSSVEKSDGEYQIALIKTGGEELVTYFLTLPKDVSVTGARLA